MQTQPAQSPSSRDHLALGAPARLRADAGGVRPHTGASVTHQNIALWRPPLRSADADSLGDARTLRARARDLYRNHPYARMAVRASSIGVIGKKLRYSCRPDHRFLGLDFEEAVRWGQEFERVWEVYAHGPGFFGDAGRRMTFTQYMRLAHRSRFVDGEAFATLEWAGNRRWKTCAQLIDVDRLSTPPGRSDSAFMRAGVELNDLSEPIAYHVRNGHPVDIAVIGIESQRFSRVDRETQWGRPIALHSYECDRPGQTRGISAFAPVIVDMKMGREFTETSLQQAILQASYAAVLVSQQNYREALEVIAGMPADQAKTVADLALENLESAMTYHENAQIKFNGSSVPILWPGEDLKLLTPGNNATSLGDFQAHATRSFAAGLGVDPISVSQDFSNVNYSSAKMSAASSWRGYEIMREDLIGDLAMPHVAAFLEEVVFSGAMPLPKGIKSHEFYDARDALIKGTFLTQGSPNLDPMKEAQALNMEMTMGTATLQDAVAEKGGDYLDTLDQMAREVMDRQARGLPPPGVPFAMMMGMQADAAAAEQEQDRPAQKEPADG